MYTFCLGDGCRIFYATHGASKLTIVYTVSRGPVPDGSIMCLTSEPEANAHHDHGRPKISEAVPAMLPNSLSSWPWIMLDTLSSSQ